MMKAMLTDPNDRSLHWSDVELPHAGPGEAVIRVRAAGVNRADLLQRAGKYPSPPGWPEWMGLEVAGDIAEVGKSVTRWKPGDRVCALLGGGGYAEYAAVPEGMIMPVPRGLGYAEAASLPETFATCRLDLFVEGGLRSGETVFFPAGGSGLAAAGIQMAHAAGAYVITTVRSAEKKRLIASLPADRIIDTSCEDLEAAVREEAEAGHPIDVAVDCVGGEDIGRLFPYVSLCCRWILVSTLGGVTASVPLRALLTKNITFKGSTLRRRSAVEKSALLEGLVRDVWPQLESGEITPRIGRILPVTEAEAAHALLSNGTVAGKVILTV